MREAMITKKTVYQSTDGKYHASHQAAVNYEAAIEFMLYYNRDRVDVPPRSPSGLIKWLRNHKKAILKLYGTDTCPTC